MVSFVSSLFRDVRYSLRALRKAPAFTVGAVVTVAWTVGATTAIFSMVGRAIRLNSEQYTVVGVLAAGFAMPVRDVEFVLPFAADQDPRRGARNSVNFIIGVGRLGENVSLPQAASELNAIARRLQERFPVENARKRGVRMVGAIDGIVGPFRTALLTVFAAVGAVLLIACANLANLMLTRATSRRKDLAVQICISPILKSTSTTSAPLPRTCSGSCARQAIR